MATFKDTQILAVGGRAVQKNHDHDLISSVVELKKRKTKKKKQKQTNKKKTPTKQPTRQQTKPQQTFYS